MVGRGESGGSGVSDFFYDESKFKIGGGGGARLSEFFYKESKS